jgi:hypothetical protein
MPEYVLNRAHTLRTTLGVVSFEKGTPTWVPPHMVMSAVNIGAEPVDGPAPDPLGEEAAEKPVVSSEDRSKALNEAFDLLVDENDPGRFTAQGVPKVAAVEQLTSLNFDKLEVYEAWAAYRIAKDESSK